MDIMDSKKIAEVLEKYLYKTIKKVQIIVSPMDIEEKLLDTDVILSLSFHEMELPLTIYTTGGQFLVINNDIWKSDFKTFEDFEREISRWKTKEFWANDLDKSLYCFDLTSKLSNISNHKIINIDIIVCEDGGDPTGLKFVFENNEEIWTGPSNYGLNSVYVTNQEFLNSDLKYPPPHIYEVRFVKV